MFLTSPLILAFAISLIVSNIRLLRNEGKAFHNLLGGMEGTLMITGLILCFVLVMRPFYGSVTELRILSEAEAAAFQKTASGEGVCIRDEERHILISVGRKQLGLLTAALVDTLGVAKSMEQGIAKPMQAYGYRYEQSQETQIGGQKAVGFSYHYVADGIPMYGQSLAVKHKKVIYNFHFYAREAQQAESLVFWNTFLAGITWES